MGRTPSRVSDDAVADATGRDWEAWVAWLDERDADSLDHPAVVGLVAEAGVDSGWWQQTVAVGYERAKGLREVGETADAGYQVGVQRTLPVGREPLWDRLVGPAGLRAWLGDVEAFEPTPGYRYETAAGTTGEVRTVRPAERLRLTWQPADRDEPTTLQLSLACPRNDDSKTTLRFHHERLADAEEREAMRARWRSVLDRLAADVVADPQSG